ncbi:LPP20 family lipoprotein [Colwellia sp. BRX10-3]|uniref:LPP20 family lipoprotein n=1 Tax=Colwellia sp. BRX10-3 TaxID=2759844 RepID=UPI0015F3C118|nr:LPP20 family lipoprotein [Colwellia sp. BRX10-3]MBA6389919.1 LPP20 family lipoprotein [Colwellia sp. BRX10-3]
MHAVNLLVLLIIFSISVKASAWPSWVYQANCSAEYFCAVGVADNQVMAKKFAFDDLSQQLQASISSRSIISVTKNGNESDATLSQKIELITESIPLNLVSVAEKAFENNQTALLIKLSKQQFYKNLTARINTFFDNISTSAQLNQQPLWQQHVWAQRQLAQQSRVENHLVLLSALNEKKTSFSGLWQKFKHWQQLILALKNKAIIEVQAPTELNVISTSINRSLTGGAGTVYWLQPSIKTKSAKDGSEYVVEVLLSLELLESEPPYRVLFTNTLKERHRASSINAAKQRAVAAIADLIDLSKGQVLFDTGTQNNTKEYL